MLTCIVVNCTNNSSVGKLSFYSVPAAVVNFDDKPYFCELSKQRREKWLAAVNRKKLTGINFQYQRVCCKHFISGKPAALEDVENPDWVPSQEMGCKLEPRAALVRNDRRIKRRTVKSTDTVPATTMNLTLDALSLKGEAQISAPTKLILHRINIFEELLQAFAQMNLRNEVIEIQIISPNGKLELGGDHDGVLREALSEFWKSFYVICTLGTFVKIPILRHDFGEKHWKAIADILYNGWLYEKYWPIKISKTFFKCILDENYKVTDTDLQYFFLHFVSESDRIVIEDAVRDFDNADTGDLIELFGTFGVKWIPSSENFNNLLKSIAHMELVQKPMFVINSFKESFSGNCSIDLDNIYTDFVPNSKNILKRLNTTDDQHKDVFDYLRKFIKESDEKTRSEFLQFCTGSNIANNDIEVLFVDAAGLKTIPVANTSSKLLELPFTYGSYLSLRNEFNKILQSRFAMDLA